MEEERGTWKETILRCTSKTTRRSQVAYIKGWAEGRKRVEEIMKLAMKKGGAATVEEAPVATDNPKQKRKAIVLEPQASVQK